MFKKNLTLFFLLASFCVFSQIGGESTYQFLNLISSPRQAALGGKVITIMDHDVSSGLYNPATINGDMDKQLAINYASHLGGIGYGTAAYAYTWDRHVNTFHAGVTYVNYGVFDGYDIDGNATGEFRGAETAISLGYAYRIPRSDLYLGANLKMISSKLEQYNSLGAALDFGMVYMIPKIDFIAALSIRNMGTQITTYNDLNEKLPLEVTFGLSQTLENIPLRWHLTFENLQQWPLGFSNPARSTSDLDGNSSEEKVGVLNEVLRHTIIGAELFPNKGFNIRIGYNFRRSEELRIVDQRNFSGLSFGIGLKLNKLRFSYTHAKYKSASNSSFFGVQIEL